MILGALNSLMNTFTRRFALLVALTLCALLPALRPAHAATFTVTTSANSGAGSLNEAITSANSTSEADDIIFGGTTGVVLTSALPAITGPLTITGYGCSVRTVSDDHSVRIFTVNTGVSVTLVGLQLSDGGTLGYGGAIKNSGFLTLTDCRFNRNRAGSGGAVSNFGGNVIIDKCTFTSNGAAADNRGGAITNINNGTTTGVMTISDSTFTSNVAGTGGAINNEGTLNVHRCTFDRNQSTSIMSGVSVGGGAIRTAGIQANIDLSTFMNNSTASKGDALLIQTATNLFSCTFYGSYQYASRNNTVFNLSDSTIIGNTLFEQNSGGVNFQNSGIGTITSRGFNLSNDATGPNNGTTDRINTATGLAPSELASDGGTSLRLLVGSAAIDQGNGAGLDGFHREITATTDQYGAPRIFDAPGIANASGGNGSDIGAYEKPNTPPTLANATYIGRSGVQFSQVLAGIDPDGQPLTYSLYEGSSLPTGLNLNPNGLISGTPLSRTTSEGVTAQITVTDGSGSYSYSRITLAIAEPPSLVVTSSSDPGDDFDDQTTLREAINFANSDPYYSDISFNLAAGSRIITLASALPDLNSDLTISGPRSGGGVTVTRAASNSSLFRIFTATSGSFARVGLNNLTISGGNVGEGGTGGGIKNSGATLSVTNCTIAGNSASFGGGVYSATSANENFSNSSTTLRNCTLTNNTALTNGEGSSGGGIYNIDGKTVLDSCTIVGNKAPAGTGAGLSTFGGTTTRTEIKNTIIAGNLSNDATPVSNLDVALLSSGDTSANFVSLGNNLVGDGNAAATARFNATGDRTNVADAALKLNALADNGGPTPTMALLIDSPAINAGQTDLSVDQRGFARPQGSADDIGAYEILNPTFGPGSLVVTTTSDENNDTSDPTVGAGTSLREAINFANSNPDQSDISFDLAVGNRTITLASALPELNTNLSIIGPTNGVGVTIARLRTYNTPRFGIFVTSGGTINFSNLTVTGGESPTVSSSPTAQVGGGILNIGAKLTVTNCTIADNEADYGGGLFSHTSSDFSSSFTVLRNCTFAGNMTNYNNEFGLGNLGGGLYISVGKVTIDSCTIVGNYGKGTNSGSGVFFESGSDTLLEISNSIIAGNLGRVSGSANDSNVDSDVAAPTNLISGGNNLIGVGNATSRFTASGDRTGITDAALKLDALADNGGPTQTLALLPGSPAINAGQTNLTTDQRGISRPQGNADDIGAFELTPDKTAPVVTIATPTANQSLSSASFTAITGNASDAGGVSQVFVKLFRTRNGVNQFWDGTSFGANALLLPATVASPNANSTTWNYAVSSALRSALDTSGYVVFAYGQDAAGNLSSAVSRNFNIDASAPVVNIETPTAGQTLSASAFTSIAGGATDNRAVSQVLIKLFRNRNGVTQYWDGTRFGSNAVLLPVPVASPGAASTSWNYAVPGALRSALDVGGYVVFAYGRDAAGNLSSAVSRAFNISSDNTAPSVVISTPAANASLPLSSFGAGTLKGTASDAGGVSQVLVKLFRTRNGVTQYWNGTAFGPTAVLLPITVASPGSTNTNWSWNTQVPSASQLDAGGYVAFVYGRDTVGNLSLAVSRAFNLTGSAAKSKATGRPSGGSS